MITPSDRQLANAIVVLARERRDSGMPIYADPIADLIGRHMSAAVVEATAAKDKTIHELRGLLCEAVREIDVAYERAGFVRAATSEQRLRFEAAINAEPVT